MNRPMTSFFTDLQCLARAVVNATATQVDENVRQEQLGLARKCAQRFLAADDTTMERLYLLCVLSDASRVGTPLRFQNGEIIIE